MIPRSRLRPAAVALLGCIACADRSVTAPAAPRAGLPPSASLGGTALAPGQPVQIVAGVGTDLCLTVDGPVADGTRVRTAACGTTDAQRFTPTDAGELRVGGSYCLDAYSAQGNDGDALVIWNCWGGANQRWTHTDAGELRGVNAKCADVYGLNPAPGGDLVIWNCWGGANQRWTVRPVAPVGPPPSESGRWVTGYYVGYQRALYPVAAVDFGSMTHLIVGSVQATPGGGVDTTFWLDDASGPAMARALAARAHQAGRKAILMLGGAGYRDQLVGATGGAYRATFVANLLRTMDELGYDGIDVDWEPLYDVDRPQVLQFLRDLRAARPGILLTFPVGWVNAIWGADAWYGQLAPLVDQMNVMSYQMADNWGGWVSWHHAALHGEAGNRPSSVASSVRAYVASGVPAAKLGIGIGAFGSCWRGVREMGVPLDGTPAAVVASDNAMSFANIMAQYYSAAAYRWDDAAKAGYLSFSAPTGPQQCTMMSYEDPRSVREKGAYVRANGLGGAIVWTVNQQYFPGAAQPSPLTQAAYDAIAP